MQILYHTIYAFKIGPIELNDAQLFSPSLTSLLNSATKPCAAHNEN